MAKEKTPGADDIFADSNLKSKTAAKQSDVSNSVFGINNCQHNYLTCYLLEVETYAAPVVLIRHFISLRFCAGIF